MFPSLRRSVKISAGEDTGDDIGPEAHFKVQPVLELQTLGDFRLRQNGEEIELPPSRKVRALLAYLAVTGRQHRRARLCTLLWADSDDPKGSLRWALSRLRNVFEKGGLAENETWRVVADRESVKLETGTGRIDILLAKNRLRRPQDCDLEELVETERDFRGPLFSGLELPDQPEFEAWRVSELAEAELLYGKLLQSLVTRLEAAPHDALPYARKRAKLEPHNRRAQADLLHLLLRCSRKDEASAHLTVARGLLRQEGPHAEEWLLNEWERFNEEGSADVEQFAVAVEQAVAREPMRRTTTVLAADVAGFSKLMGADETGTIGALRTLREKVWDPQIQNHGGRVLSTAGDGVIAGFEEPQKAVKAGMAMQEALTEDGRVGLQAPIKQRIGVHMGPVLFVDNDVLGAPLAIADALQKLCHVGGVVISSDVHAELGDTLKTAFGKIGELNFSDFATSVTSYGWSPADHELPAVESMETVKEIKRPCVAVLPFANLSGDPTQDYIGQGMADDLITELTKFRWFDVVARDSSFAYQDRAANTQLIASELDVDYILEGSVRLARPRIRVSAQLIDGETGRLVWTDQFDGSLDAIFDFKDEISDKIVGAIEPELSHVERERAVSKKPGSLELWDIYQKGVWHLTRFNPDDLAEADSCFRQVIQMDPKFHRGHAYLAILRYLSVLVNDPTDADVRLEEGERHGRLAVSLDFYDPLGHYALGLVLLSRRQLSDALFEFQTALDLNPRFAYANFGMALTLRGMGQPGEAAEHFLRVIRLSPRDPILWSAHWGLAFSYLLDGQYENAEYECAQARQYPETGYWPDVTQVALLVAKGETKKAKGELAKCLASWPGITREHLLSQARILSADGPSFDRFLDLLAEAGLPCDG